MNYANLSTTEYILRLDPGDDVLESIQNFCTKENINNAGIQGIGSIESPTLAHYAMQTKLLSDKKLSGEYEVISLIGNVALVDGMAFAHVHVSLSNSDLQTFGGHLVQGKTSATLEIIVTAYPSHHWKNTNEDIGLKVWDFGAH